MGAAYRRGLVQLYDLHKGGLSHPQAKTFATILASIPGPLVGLDIGIKHVGVALSDSERRIAFSHGAFERLDVRRDIGKINDLIDHASVRAAVVGMPSQALGHDNEKLQRFIRAYARGVLQECGIDLVGFWDESFSSQLAKDAFMRRSRQGIRNSRRIRKRTVDADAAALILQDALDALKQIQ